MQLLLAVIAQKCCTYGERNEQVIIIIIITTMVSPIPSISHIEGKNINFHRLCVLFWSLVIEWRNVSWSVCSVSPSPGRYHAPLLCLPRRSSSSCTDPPSAWCQSGPCQECKPLFLHNIIIVICCKSCTCTNNIERKLCIYGINHVYKLSQFSSTLITDCTMKFLYPY